MASGLESQTTSDQQRGSGAVIRRRRLCVRVVHDTGAGPRVTTVVAPAGYGKSVLLRELVGGGEGAKSGLYLSLRDCEHHPALFLDLLAAAVQSRLPNADLRPLLMLKKSSPAEEYGERLPYVLARVFEPTSSEPVLLALDDLQEVAPGEPLTELIRGLLDSEPSRLRIMLASRRELPFDLSGYGERGELLSLRSDELAFSIEEIAEVLGARQSRPVTPAEVRSVWNRTRGWPAVVGLLEFSGGHGEPAWQGNGALNDFVVSDLLGDLRPPLRYVLKAVSILDGIEPEAARALLSEPVNGRQLRGPVNRFISVPEIQVAKHLDELRANQLVSSPVVPEGANEVNPTIRDVLCELFEREDPRAFRLAHHRAAEHYLGQDAQASIATIEHLVQAGDFDRALALLEEQVESLHDAGAHGVLSRWLRSLEAHFATLPLWVCYYLGRYDTTEGNWDRARGYFETCKEGLKAWDAAGELWRWQPKVCLGFATMYWRRGSGDEARTYCRRGLDFMRQLWRKGGITAEHEAESRRVQLDLLNLLGTLKLERGIYDKVDEVASEAVAVARDAHRPRAEAEALRQLGVVAAYRGDFEAARASFDEAHERLDPVKHAYHHALVAYEMSRLTRRQGDAEGGRRGLEESVPLLFQAGHPATVARALGVLGEARAEDGDGAGAAEAFERALHVAESVSDAKIRTELLDRQAISLAAQGCIEEARGQLKQASECLAGQFKTQVHLNAHHYEARAECAAASGDHCKATQHFNHAVERADRIGALYHVARLAWRAARHNHDAFVAGEESTPEAVLAFMETAAAAMGSAFVTTARSAGEPVLHVGAAFGTDTVREVCSAMLVARGVAPETCGVAGLDAEVLERYRDYRRRAELEDDFVLVERTGRRGANARDVEKALGSMPRKAVVLLVEKQLLVNAGVEVSLAEKRVILPLLLHFLRHPDDVFTMSELSGQVWSASEAKKSMQTKVKVAISRLRGLLGKDRTYILTSRVPVGDDGETVVGYGLAGGFPYLVVERVSEDERV